MRATEIRKSWDKIDGARESLQILRQAIWSILCQFQQAKAQFEQRIAGESKVQALRKAIENLNYAGETEAADAVNDTLVRLVENAIGNVNLGAPYQYLIFLLLRTETMYKEMEGTLKEMQVQLDALSAQIIAVEGEHK